MADFCKQCSEELFGEDYGDLSDLLRDGFIKYSNYEVSVICEGCGFTIVDKLGACVSKDCKKHSCGYIEKTV